MSGWNESKVDGFVGKMARQRLRRVDVSEGQQIERNRTDIPKRWRKTKRQLKEVAEIPYEGEFHTRGSIRRGDRRFRLFLFIYDSVSTSGVSAWFPPCHSSRRNPSFSFEEFFIRSGSESLLSFFRRVSYVSYTGSWNEHQRYIAFWGKFQEYLSRIVTIHRSFSGNKPAVSFSKFVDTHDDPSSFNN